ncbi:hypothetical protein WN51_14538 [Melipona quadrifasciata]|uniref:Uncharacterized protein n=1 Tax=Melipona quadrifasciata TaxID=166423 RepID=A0A0N0BFK6_9HYME|nr:hypothetical protein WN51_14538 [Melipona quadrifasciata]
MKSFQTQDHGFSLDFMDSVHVLVDRGLKIMSCWISLYGSYTHNRVLLNIFEIFGAFDGAWTRDYGSLDLGSHFMDPIRTVILRHFYGSWTQNHGLLDLGSHFMDPIRRIVVCLIFSRLSNVLLDHGLKIIGSLDHESHFMDTNTHSRIWLNIFEILRRFYGSWTQNHGSLDLILWILHAQSLGSGKAILKIEQQLVIVSYNPGQRYLNIEFQFRGIYSRFTFFASLSLPQLRRTHQRFQKTARWHTPDSAEEIARNESKGWDTGSKRGETGREGDYSAEGRSCGAELKIKNEIKHQKNDYFLFLRENSVLSIPSIPNIPSIFLRYLQPSFAGEPLQLHGSIGGPPVAVVLVLNNLKSTVALEYRKVMVYVGTAQIKGFANGIAGYSRVWENPCIGFCGLCYQTTIKMFTIQKRNFIELYEYFNFFPKIAGFARRFSTVILFLSTCLKEQLTNVGQTSDMSQIFEFAEREAPCRKGHHLEIPAEKTNHHFRDVLMEDRLEISSITITESDLASSGATLMQRKLVIGWFGSLLHLREYLLLVNVHHQAQNVCKRKRKNVESALTNQLKSPKDINQTLGVTRTRASNDGGEIAKNPGLRPNNFTHPGLYPPEPEQSLEQITEPKFQITPSGKRNHG